MFGHRTPEAFDLPLIFRVPDQIVQCVGIILVVGNVRSLDAYVTRRDRVIAVWTDRNHLPVLDVDLDTTERLAGPDFAGCTVRRHFGSFWAQNPGSRHNIHQQ